MTSKQQQITMPKKSDPLTLEEMTEAAETFFPLLTVVHSKMPKSATIEDSLKVMEAVAKLGHKLRADKAAKERELKFGFNQTKADN